MEEHETIENNTIILPVPAIETEDYADNKLIFEYEKKAQLGKEIDTHNQIQRAEELFYEFQKENHDEENMTENNGNYNNNNNLNQIDDIIDVFKSREINDSMKGDEMLTSLNKLSKDEVNEENERNLKETKKFHKVRSINKSGHFNFWENSKGLINKGSDSHKDDAPRHRKNMSSVYNPFIKNYEVDVVDTSIIINYFL